jgi:hypothetical protein
LVGCKAADRLPIPLRILETALLNKVRDRVQVESSRVAPEPQRLQRDSAAPGKAVEDFWGAPRIGFSKPFPQWIHPATITASFKLGGCGHQLKNVPALPIVTGIREERPEDHRATHRQRTPRPPEMHSRDVPVSQTFLSGRRSVHRLQRQFLFNQPADRHERFPSAASITA